MFHRMSIECSIESIEVPSNVLLQRLLAADSVERALKLLASEYDESQRSLLVDGSAELRMGRDIDTGIQFMAYMVMAYIVMAYMVMACEWAVISTAVQRTKIEIEKRRAEQAHGLESAQLDRHNKISPSTGITKHPHRTYRAT